MNNKKHYVISLVKSIIRIISSIFCVLFRKKPLASLTILGAGYGIAEIVGILEEVVGTDRKEGKTE